MIPSDEVQHSIGHALKSLWLNWAYGLGLITVLNLLAIIMSKQWLPVLALCMGVILYTSVRINVYNTRPSCMRILYACMLTLIWSAVTMFLINILYANGVIEALSMNPLNPRIPFITPLVLSTVGICVSGWLLWRGLSHHFCRDCIIVYGNEVERGFVGRIYSQEGNVQVRTMLMLMLVIAVSDYIYYALFYINVNYNSPDRFFFFYVPTLLYIISLVFLGVRYLCVGAYYHRSLAVNPINQCRITSVRFLIINGDELFLTFPGEDAQFGHIGDEKIDTPAKLKVSYKERVTGDEADQYFKAISGLSSVRHRFLYSHRGADTGCNVFHFAIFVNDKAEMLKSNCKGRWVPLNVLQRLSAEGKVSPQLVSEIMRIHNATLAWKSYDRRGYRLYDIKNYKPAFRLRDLPNWDIDYNDPVWLLVAENNEDRMFFRLRRLWRKYITGLSE